jgi:hypothetical protein
MLNYFKEGPTHFLAMDLLGPLPKREVLSKIQVSFNTFLFYQMHFLNFWIAKRAFWVGTGLSNGH